MINSLLPFFAVVRVSGDDRHDFLHNQLSNDINHLAEGQACYATYNTPKGRVIANMLIKNGGDHLLLVLAADLAETVVKRLKMFVLRAKVQFEILPDWGVAGFLPDAAATVYPDEPQLLLPQSSDGATLLPHSGSLKIAPLADLPPHQAQAEAAWQAHEIRCGYPWISAATSETCVAQMLNQHRIGGIHFRKGCYPGQEIIARAQYRGQVKRGLAVADSGTPLAAGAAVSAAGAEAGLVINASGSLNLLVIKYAAAGQTLQDDNGGALTLRHCFFDTDHDEQE